MNSTEHTETDFKTLIKIAAKAARPRQLTAGTSVGDVGAALLTDRGNVYTGINIDTYCSMGFCAEHAAIAAMVTAGENRIVKLVAVSAKSGVVPPCGRCREMIHQIHPDNMDCQIQLKDRVVTLRELLPDCWEADEADETAQPSKGEKENTES